MKKKCAKLKQYATASMIPSKTQSACRIIVILVTECLFALHMHKMLDKFDEYKIKTKINIHKNTVCYDFIFNMNIPPDQNNHA